MRRWPAVAVAAALLLGACAVPAPPPSPSPAATVDLQALREQFGLPDCPPTDADAVAVTDGLPVTALPCLGSDVVVNLAGLPRVPTVVNFWAQWCGPCRTESPFLREASQELAGVSFVGINYDDPQPDWAVEFAGLVEWKYPHVQDAQRALQIPLKVPGLPLTLFVAADGRVVARHAGPFESTAQLTALVEEHLDP